MVSPEEPPVTPLGPREHKPHMMPPILAHKVKVKVKCPHLFDLYSKPAEIHQNLTSKLQITAHFLYRKKIQK